MEKVTAVLLTGHENALIGFIEKGDQHHAVYDREVIIDNIQVSLDDDGDETREDAIEFFCFNVEPLGSMENGPVFLFKRLEDEYPEQFQQ